MTELVADSVRTFTERYRFPLQESVVASLYPESDDFAVSTDGLPGIRLLGVGLRLSGEHGQPPRAAGKGNSTGAPRYGMRWLMCSPWKATGNLVSRWFSEGVSGL